MDAITVYSEWKNGEYQRYFLSKDGQKVILEESKGQPPFVKVELVHMDWNPAGDARSAEESSSD